MNENIHLVQEREEGTDWYSAHLSTVYGGGLVVETRHFDTGEEEIPVQTYFNEYGIDFTVNGENIEDL